MCDIGAGSGRNGGRRVASDKKIRILQTIECSSMVSTWKEYLCLEIHKGRTVLSHRRYDVLGEISDFAVENDEGDVEYRIPEVIDGKTVMGTDDDFVVGGELTADPSDPEPELDPANVEPDKVRAWLTERGFELNAELAEIWAGIPLEGRIPKVQASDEIEEPEGVASPVEPPATTVIAPVTQLRIRLKRWMDFAATAENDYPAEVITEGDRFYYRARGATVPITEHEAVQVISNPFLYYFSTALKLHERIGVAKATEMATQLSALIGECCPGWDVLEQRTREDWFETLKTQFGVSGYQKEGMEEPVKFAIDSLELAEEQAAIVALDESALADWLGDLHDPVVELGPLARQLQDLAARVRELQLAPTVTTAGMKYCGTITSARIRVTMPGGNSAAALDIRPVDCHWETCVDRTFGWMWESPDDY